MKVKPGCLAVVVRGLWPNMGRIVYVSHFVKEVDFTLMGLGKLPGWRIRSINRTPLETVLGPAMSGYTPVGSLRPLDPLEPPQALNLHRRMAVADFKEAMSNLASVLEREAAEEGASQPEVAVITSSAARSAPHAVQSEGQLDRLGVSR